MMDSVAQARRQMVEQQIAARGVSDPYVLRAMGRVPREDFVDPSYRDTAYGDYPLQIGKGQTISQPYIVALMIEGAKVRPESRVLEIGAGSGYASAVMAEIGAHVFAIERHDELADTARTRLKRLGYANVELRTGDGSLGWPEHAPFDAIVVSAASPAVPQSLKEQIATGGQLVIPVGGFPQTLTRITRGGAGEFTTRNLGAVAFVPLIGAEGWNGKR